MENQKQKGPSWLRAEFLVIGLVLVAGLVFAAARGGLNGYGSVVGGPDTQYSGYTCDELARMMESGDDKAGDEYDLRCYPVDECPDGTYRDNAGACVKDESSDECPEGTYRDNAGVCVKDESSDECSDGMYRDNAGACVKEESSDELGDECPAGMYFDSAGACLKSGETDGKVYDCSRLKYDNLGNIVEDQTYDHDTGDKTSVDELKRYCKEHGQIKEPGRDYCKDLRDKAESGDENAKEEYNRACVSQYDLNCDELKKLSESGDEKAASEYKRYCQPKNEDRKPVERFCEKLKKLFEEGNYTEKEKKMYLQLCTKDRPEDNVCKKLDNAVGDKSVDSSLGDPENFRKLCTYQPQYDKGDVYCEKLKAVMTDLADDTTTQDYMLAKQKYVAYCEKQIPPAGYEDEVISEYDSTDNPFSDTETCSLGGKAAFELYRRAVIGGFEDGTFRGDKPVNRAEAAKFLLLARFGSVEDKDNNGKFHDVSGKPWFIRYIMKAAELGIINGHPDGSFKPADGVTRAEFLKMLSLTFDIETNLPYSYDDVPTDAWFAKYVGIAGKYNLFPANLDKCGEDTTNVSDSSLLDPGHKLTRYEVAVAIYQYLINRETTTGV